MRRNRIQSNNQFIGRRTGLDVVSGKNIRKREDGTDVFEDYWTDSDEENLTLEAKPLNPIHDNSNHLSSDIASPEEDNCRNRPAVIQVENQNGKKSNKLQLETKTLKQKNNKSFQKTSRKKNTKNAVDDCSNLRRSSRNRMAPLDYWRNERMKYRFTASGDIQRLCLEPGSSDDHAAWSKMQRKKEKKEVKRKKNDAVPLTDNYLEYGVTVLDPETKEEVQADIVRPYKALSWRGSEHSSKRNCKQFDIGKAFQLEEATFGFLKLGGMQEKPLQYLPNNDVVFVIMSGTLEVRIHETVMMLKENDTFLVPQGNPYSVTNLKDSEALLTFVAVTHSFLDELKK